MLTGSTEIGEQLGLDNSNSLEERHTRLLGSA